jgi:peptide/nickel transport system permease protein
MSVAAAVSVVVFAITALLPGDAARSSSARTPRPKRWPALRAQMGLDLPARCAI